MPIAINPDQTYRVYLKADSPIDEASRPAFLFRYLLARESVTVDAERDAIGQAVEATKTEAEKTILFDRAMASMLPHFRGVSNLPAGFGLDSLTWDEFWELFWTYRDCQRLTEFDRKKSASAPNSAGAASVQTARVADAKSPAQTNPSPSASPALDATATIPNANHVEVRATLI